MHQQEEEASGNLFLLTKNFSRIPNLLIQDISALLRNYSNQYS